jgi:hypothetical protein
MRRLSIAYLAFVVVTSLVGCGSGTPTVFTPTIKITSPASNATVTLPPLPQPQVVAVTFETNWNLRAHGQCGVDSHCGHVDVLVDSSTCNEVGKTFNAQSLISPAQADLGKCQSATGQHTITLELHDDSDVQVKTPLGDVVLANVTVIAQ